MENTIIIPALEKACENLPQRYVDAHKMCRIYSLRYDQVKKVARESNSFKMMRQMSLVDSVRFDDYFREKFGEEKMMQRKIVDDSELCNEVNSGAKKYVRYQEGAGLYSLGIKSFVALANEADSVRKIGGVCLVSIDKLNKYIESNYH